MAFGIDRIELGCHRLEVDCALWDGRGRMRGEKKGVALDVALSKRCASVCMYDEQFGELQVGNMRTKPLMELEALRHFCRCTVWQQGRKQVRGELSLPPHPPIHPAQPGPPSFPRPRLLPRLRSANTRRLWSVCCVARQGVLAYRAHRRSLPRARVRELARSANRRRRGEGLETRPFH